MHELTASQLVAIVTRSDTGSHNRLDLIQSLVPTHYVCISLSSISIKTNFKQITKVELNFVQYSEGGYILCMTSRYFCRLFTNVTLLCFVSHSNDMMSLQSSSAEKISCNIVPFFYHHSVVIKHLVSVRLLSLVSKENVHNIR